VCGCEGTVAGKGSHTLAFVGWLFRFIFCLYAANLQLLLSFFRLCLTFGGMWRWRRVAVARVFALVVRWSIMMLFVYCRVSKNRDTRRESPAGAGAGRTADHLAILFSQKVLAVRSANDIYRPVTTRFLID
jgi:hypothetical protein